MGADCSAPKLGRYFAGLLGPVRHLRHALRRVVDRRLGVLAHPPVSADDLAHPTPVVALHLPEDAAAICRELASPRIKINYDYSHFQLQNLDLETTLKAALPPGWLGQQRQGRASGQRRQAWLALEPDGLHRRDVGSDA